MKRPVFLVYFETFSSKNAAMSREWHIKKMSKQQKERLIMENKIMKIVLASASPRRKELLLQVGVDFEVCPADIDEACDLDNPAEYVEYLSNKKARFVHELHKDEVVVAADTVVAYDNHILGKPEDENAAFEMLKLLSGQLHKVYTGVTIIDKDDNINTFSVCTKVKMFENSDETIKAYIDTKECMDKAGAYGIQGNGAILVEKIDGDYNNVVGLPVSKVYSELRKLTW